MIRKILFLFFLANSIFLLFDLAFAQSTSSTHEIIDLEIFKNGDSFNGVNIQLTSEDCELSESVGLNKVILTKMISSLPNEKKSNDHRIPEIFNGQGILISSCSHLKTFIDNQDQGPILIKNIIII